MLCRDRLAEAHPWIPTRATEHVSEDHDYNLIDGSPFDPLHAIKRLLIMCLVSRFALNDTVLIALSYTQAEFVRFRPSRRASVCD